MKKNEGKPRANGLCGARTRKGTSCANRGMANGRCRMHGGKSTGPRTMEGRERIARARRKHGRYSKQAQEERSLFRDDLRRCRGLMRRMGGQKGDEITDRKVKTVGCTENAKE